MNITDRQKADYLHRSYTAVDGLWFLKVEERWGFEAALEIDHNVWKVLPKIQARKLQELTGMTRGCAALCRCFSLKLEWDGFEFDLTEDPAARECTFTIRQCPWFNLLLKSKREHLADRIAEKICVTECATWADAFGGLQCEWKKRHCGGGEFCQLCFREP